jgi:hypothetical protein
MALIRADRVKETSTSTGTGTFTLAGADSTYRTFASVCAVADTVYYAIAHRTANEWEVGLGTYSATNTLTRTTVHSSSNANAAVTFSAGTKDVLLALTKTQLETYASLAGTETLTNKTINASSNTITNVSLASAVTGTLPLANGGTGTTTAQLAINALAGAVTSGSYLRGNGTNVVMAAISAGDVPTLNQNTTGTASGSVSGTASYLAKFTGTNVVGNSIIYDSGTNVGIGTTTTSDKLHVIGNVRAGNYTYGYLAMTGDLPGYANGVYPTLKSDQTIYFSADGKYSAYLGDTSKNVFGLLHPTTGTGNVLLNPNGTSYFAGGSVAIGATTAPAGQLYVAPQAAATKGLVVRGASAQTANVVEYQNSAGTVVYAVTYDSTSVQHATYAPVAGNNANVTCYGGPSGSYPFIGITYQGVVGQTGYSGLGGYLNCYNNPIHIHTYSSHDVIFVLGNVEKGRLTTTGALSLNSGSSPGAQLHVTSAAAATKGLIVLGASAQSANLQEWQDNAGSTLAAVLSNGAIQPASMADSAAANNTIYYSTTASKLVYKNSAGTVNNLY